MSGPHKFADNGKWITVWKVQCTKDGDCEEMTASEIEHWKMPIKEVWTLATRSRPKQPKKTVTWKLSGDWAEELEHVLPKPGNEASAAPTHKRWSAHPQQQAPEQAHLNFLDSNPYLPMDAIRMYKAAACQIHLSDHDSYEELLHNSNKVETP